MKRIILLLVLVPFIFSSVSKGQNNSPVALVKKIVKDVTFKKTSDSEWDFAKTGTPLMDGGLVKTGSKSLALVLFTEGSLLRVRENSILNIYGSKEGNKVSRNTVITKGTLGFDVQKQGDDEFKFTTPTAVASIRGTDGLIFCDSTVTRVYLENGELYIESTTDPTKNGRIVGGEKITQNQDGTFTTTPLTDDERNIITQAKTQTTKKVIIKTAHGDVEIEYYTSDKQ
ncbi:MAG: FecR family protein [Ignavibacteria bacterium]|nr:FecR family protein [Ignavibacteria bacterium]